MPGYTDRKDAVQKRLRRIEGQVRGLQRMVDDDKYCVDILDQVAAVTRALQAVAIELLDDHLTHCVTDAVAAGGRAADEKDAEASAAIARLVPSRPCPTSLRRSRFPISARPCVKGSSCSG